MDDHKITALVDSLAAIPGNDRLFNPYDPSEPGASVRQANLAHYLTDLQQFDPGILMVAEAPGYRGCALSGIPVTSERIILNGVEKWGLFGADSGYGTTSGHPEGVAEMTATILWGALTAYLDKPPVLWNTVPLHPHKPDNRQSNRSPLVGERRTGAVYIERVMELYNFDLVLAVGRTAQRMLGEREIDFIPLRHPAQGGKNEFVAGLQQAVTGRRG